MIFFVKSLVEPVVTSFSGLLVTDSFPNYLYVFCLSDVFYAICLLMTIFWLKFDEVKENKSIATLSLIKSGRKMMNPAVAVFLATVLCFGVLNGVRSKHTMKRSSTVPVDGYVRTHVRRR